MTLGVQIAEITSSIPKLSKKMQKLCTLVQVWKINLIKHADVNFIQKVIGLVKIKKRVK